MTPMKPLALGLATAALVAGAAIAESHAETPPAVGARKAQMQLYAFNLGTLGAMAQGNMDYDADAATAAAGNIVKLSTLAAGPMWAPGTGADAVETSRALPAIWENMDDVISKAMALNEAAMAMETAAAEGLEPLQAAMKDLGAACGACHKEYREPE